MWIDDQVMVQCQQPVSMEVWVPDDTIVVLGSSNNPLRECQVENCKKDGVSILKRYGGGGAVVLHSGVVVLSIGAWVKDRFNNADFFSRINTTVIETIQHESPHFLTMCQKGISDLVICDRKVAGTSLFRSRNYLLYQASILVDTKVHLIERYLRHPSLEPDYRQNKKHRDFIAGLNDFDPTMTPVNIASTFKQEFLKRFEVGLNDQLIDSSSDQCPHLLKRIENAKQT